MKRDEKWEEEEGWLGEILGEAREVVGMGCIGWSKDFSEFVNVCEVMRRVIGEWAEVHTEREVMRLLRHGLVKRKLGGVVHGILVSGEDEGREVKAILEKGSLG